MHTHTYMYAHIYIQYHAYIYIKYIRDAYIHESTFCKHKPNESSAECVAFCTAAVILSCSVPLAMGTIVEPLHVCMYVGMYVCVWSCSVPLAHGYYCRAPARMYVCVCMVMLCGR